MRLQEYKVSPACPHPGSPFFFVLDLRHKARHKKANPSQDFLFVTSNQSRHRLQEIASETMQFLSVLTFLAVAASAGRLRRQTRPLWSRYELTLSA